MKRRDFLKLGSITGALAAVGCTQESAHFLVPFLNPPEDLVPGKATWYASTCRQCPAGCGILGRSREARIVKVEGNARHPVNQGRLCARGQALLQEQYSPDRLSGPLLREGGALVPASWEAALARLNDEARAAGGALAVLSGLENGYAADLLAGWLARHGGGDLLFYEPIAYEPLREANRIVFGQDALPAMDLSGCDLLLSLGAAFLETWISPVEFARHYVAARNPQGPNAVFVHAGPRLSLTGASADRWLATRPGAEADLAFAVLAALLRHGTGDPGTRARIEAALAGHSLEDLAARAGADPELVARLARRMAEAKQPLVLADGNTDAAVAANLINVLVGSAARCLDFSRPHALSRVARSAALGDLLARMADGRVKMLVVHRANPVYALPGFAEAAAKVPFLAVIDSCESETARAAHLVLAAHTPYESWGTYSPRPGVVGLVQPMMGPIVDSLPLEAILAAPGQVGKDRPHIAFAKYASAKLGLAEAGYAAPLRKVLGEGVVAAPDAGKGDLPPVNLDGYVYRPAAREAGLSLVAFPSVKFFDGRDANKPWLQELPDPISMVTWDDWVEVHPDTAAARGLTEGDIVEVAVRGGSAKGRYPVHLYPYLHPEALAVPLGLGHTRGGRFADGRGQNAWLLVAGPGAASAATLTPTGERTRLARTVITDRQHGREIVGIHNPREVPRGGENGHGPRVRLPIAEEHDPHYDVYPPVRHGQDALHKYRHGYYRWGMVIDLDKCIGCSACVVACYAENNVPVVGKKVVLEQREMAWLHIERYFEPGVGSGILFLPMLCQHCNNAPCETVCPVYAPHHDYEGLNNQIYNRCVGTRYCSQNCPYKVRRFNFYTYKAEPPLPMQFNPDVTVRNKGVMEKCSFCVQRIKDAHQVANREKRRIRDGEVVPACAQTCPAGAISFGNLLKDEKDGSKDGVRLLFEKERGRAHQVLAELNTLPAVIYLKKIRREDGLA